MFMRVYIGKLKSNDFNYEEEGDWNDYSPRKICVCDATERIAKGEKGVHCRCTGIRTPCYYLYWDIVGACSKQTDWGTFTIKMNKSDLVAFLSKERYKEEAVNLLSIAMSLSDSEEYLLVAQES